MDNKLLYRIPYILIGNKCDKKDELQANNINIHSPLSNIKSKCVIDGYFHRMNEQMPNEIIQLCFKYYYIDFDYITNKEALLMQKEINALKYFENSALTQTGIKEIFEESCIICRSVQKQGLQKVQKEYTKSTKDCLVM